MTESNPAFRRFHNALRIMLNLDRADLDAASVFSKDEAIAATQWAAFTCDPYRFFIKTPTPIAERLWALIESRQDQAAARAKRRATYGDHTA
jgi:hypothetical protein